MAKPTADATARTTTTAIRPSTTNIPAPSMRTGIPDQITIPGEPPDQAVTWIALPCPTVTSKPVTSLPDTAADPGYQPVPSALSVIQFPARTRFPLESITQSWQFVPTGMPVTFVSIWSPQPIWL